MKNILALIASFFFCALCILPLGASAHHSYAVYDIDNLTRLQGKVVSYRYAEPHPVIMLEAVSANGDSETWYIEGPSIRHWREFSLPTEIANEGEWVGISGWASRDGSSKMLLSAVERASGEQIVILDRVRQAAARAEAARVRAQSETP